MNTVVNVLAMIILIAIVAGLAYGLWGIGQLWELYALLEPQTRLLFFTGIAVLLIGSLIIAWGFRTAARVSVRGRLNDRRLAVYRQLVAYYAGLVGEVEAAKLHSGWKSPFALTAELTLVASPEVLEANQKIATVLQDDPVHPEELRDAVRYLIMAMRRELGHRESDERLLIPWNHLSDHLDASGNAHSRTDVENDAHVEGPDIPRQPH